MWLIAALTVCSLTDCSRDSYEMGRVEIDPETAPTMTTTNVSSLISDSGMVRYKMDAPLWLVYDDAQDSRWTFPDGLHIVRFDLNMAPEATISCDSAIYFRSRQLWRLDGYVEITNQEGERFLTPQLFWDQGSQEVYSDSFIQIIRPDRIMEGYGFRSNQNMTDYTISQVSGIFPAAQFTGASESQNDTTNTSPQASRSHSKFPVGHDTSVEPAKPDTAMPLPPPPPPGKRRPVKRDKS